MLNKIVVMGRLTRDPELRYTGNNIPVVSFTVAVDRDFTGKDKEKQTDFINCAAWRNTAEYVSKFFTKGELVVVSGSLHSRKWEKDGVKNTAWEISVDGIYHAGGKRSESDAQAGTEQRSESDALACTELQETEGEEEEDTSLPF